MEIKKSFMKKENEFLLVSVKSKTNNQSSSVYVVERSSIGAFIASNLTSDTIILIDSVETFLSSTD